MREISFSEAFTAEKALKIQVINDIYEGNAGAEKFISEFASRLGQMGANRWQIKEHKIKMFREVADVVNNESIAPNVMDKFVMYHRNATNPSAVQIEKDTNKAAKKKAKL